MHQSSILVVKTLSGDGEPLQAVTDVAVVVVAAVVVAAVAAIVVVVVAAVDHPRLTFPSSYLDFN